MPRLRPSTDGVTLATLVALVAAAVACGDGVGRDARSRSTPRAAREAPATVDVTIDEWSLKTSNGRAQAGQVTFAVLNKGQAVHELTVVRSDRPPARLPQASGVTTSRRSKSRAARFTSPAASATNCGSLW